MVREKSRECHNHKPQPFSRFKRSKFHFQSTSHYLVHDSEFTIQSTVHDSIHDSNSACFLFNTRFTIQSTFRIHDSVRGSLFRYKSNIVILSVPYSLFGYLFTPRVPISITLVTIQSTIRNPQISPRLAIQPTIQILLVKYSAHGSLFSTRFSLRPTIQFTIQILPVPYLLHGYLFNARFNVPGSLFRARFLFSLRFGINDSVRVSLFRYDSNVVSSLFT